MKGFFAFLPPFPALQEGGFSVSMDFAAAGPTGARGIFFHACGESGRLRWLHGRQACLPRGWPEGGKKQTAFLPVQAEESAGERQR